ncbi:hypothetical protein CEXT_797431 [Caerostris extrusa]|uniref:Uncharacterized protein n=1 Tax=Caerostris extrusa TaxID=172846 RepID=A0AAV4QCC5_CAEEX|nr:hypothetical protein CEXT_797431 [Caerostris extrusa]
MYQKCHFFLVVFLLSCNSSKLANTGLSHLRLRARFLSKLKLKTEQFQPEICIFPITFSFIPTTSLPRLKPTLTISKASPFHKDLWIRTSSDCQFREISEISVVIVDFEIISSFCIMMMTTKSEGITISLVIKDNAVWRNQRDFRCHSRFRNNIFFCIMMMTTKSEGITISLVIKDNDFR